MNNDDKILRILEPIQGDVKQTQDDMCRHLDKCLFLLPNIVNSKLLIKTLTNGIIYSIINITSIQEGRYIFKRITVKGEPKNDYYVVTVLIN